MAKVASKPRHELGDVQEVDPEFLDVGQRRESTQGTPAEHSRRNFPPAIGDTCEDVQLLDQGKQAEHVLVPDDIGPSESSIPRPVGVNDEGVMEMRNGGDVPRVTGQGACAETELVVDQVSDDDLNDVLRKAGDRGRGCGGSVRRRTP